MTAERTIFVLGTLPLMAAATWLLVLRSPHAALARAPSVAQPRGVLSELTDRAGFVGVIVAGQDAELGAELAGDVVHVFAEPGAHVQRGQAIMQLSASAAVGARGIAAAQALEDRAALNAAKLAWEDARDKADRCALAPSAYPASELAKTRADAARALAEVERVRGSAALHRASLQRELQRADKQVVRAPFDGVLAARLLDVGDFASSGQALARVVDDARFVRFALPAGQHRLLQVGAFVQALPAGMLSALSAQIVDVDPELDAAAGLGFARARLPSAGSLAQRLTPGTRVAVSSGELESRVLQP